MHYQARLLARGRTALAGDAAHAASPMVGGGFRQGLYDVAALTRMLTTAPTAAEIPGALQRYQELRRRPAAEHVAVSERATTAYLSHASHSE